MFSSRRALVTGITGQDGSFLAELLLGKGYEVWGLIRRSSSFNTGRIEHLYQDPHNFRAKLHLVYGDLDDATSLSNALEQSEPDEVYNLAAQSHVRVSFDIPEYTVGVTGLGVTRLLDAIKRLGMRKIRYYQASSSELFGKVHETPQRETTPFHPRSPYAVAKAAAFYTTQMYREAYGMFAVNGILFNHTSERRGETFVTRKITRAATRIAMGLQEKLYLGNLSAKRDWGYARDFVNGMWLMLQHNEPDDYVLATGETHSVREFLAAVFDRLDLDYRRYVEHDSRYERPAEVDLLLGDASKARNELGWAPTVGFDELVRLMVESDLRLAEMEKQCSNFRT